MKLKLNFKNKKLVWLCLVAILLFGFYLRYYHIDYPVVGYHNWKETHYLTEAREFAENGFFQDGVFIPRRDYFYNGDPATGVHGDSFPTISIAVGGLFKLFGPSLAIARLVNVFFVLGAIFFAFLIIHRLFRRYSLALVTAAIMATMPLLVFYGRQVQLINPGLFFAMFGVYYYLNWIEKPSYKNLFVFSIAITLSVMTKYSNFLYGIPMAAIFPWKRVFTKQGWQKYWKQCLVFLGCFSFILFWIWYVAAVSAKLGTLNIGAGGNAIDPSVLFTELFWSSIKVYLEENYTILGHFAAMLGCFMFAFKYGKSWHKNFNEESVTESHGARFMLAYVIGAIPWFVAMSFKLGGHSYHQYPLAFLFAFMLAMFMYCLAELCAKLFTRFLPSFANWKTFLKVSVMLICVLFFFSLAKQVSNTLFNTQYPGVDTAGDFIKRHSHPDDVMFHSGGQSHGMLWHADRKGVSFTTNLTLFKELEKQYGAKWVVLYDKSIYTKKPPEIADYLHKHYTLRQYAFSFLADDSILLNYYILERSDNPPVPYPRSMQEFSSLRETRKSVVRQTNYEFVHGTSKFIQVTFVQNPDLVGSGFQSKGKA